MSREQGIFGNAARSRFLPRAERVGGISVNSGSSGCQATMPAVVFEDATE